jgi:DNA-binding NarL/FixJ family response regulator
MNTLLVLDDHPIVADAICELAADTLTDWVPVRASSLQIALKLMTESTILAAVVDLELTDSKGIDTVKSLFKASPTLKVFVYSGGVSDGIREEVLAAGALAFVSKGANRLQLAKTLQQHLTKAGIFERRDLTSITNGSAVALTIRQRDVLRRVVAGERNSEIATTLGMSVETVKTHMRALFIATECSNRTELARWATQHFPSVSMASR